jgi:RNA polymerase sigma-70 factor (ECF subfamily)
VTDPDALLVARCRAGDVGAFEALYRTHAPRIHSLAARMTGSPEHGEDLLQEIFLQAYQRLDSFKGDAAFGTWLYRLAINRCLDFVRSRQMRTEVLSESLEEAGLKPCAPSVDQSRSCAATAGVDPVAQMDLDRAIRRLPPSYRQAFVLHDVEGFAHHEIAEMLGIAEGTSKSHVFKARMKLREWLR